MPSTPPYFPSYQIVRVQFNTSYPPATITITDTPDFFDASDEAVYVSFQIPLPASPGTYTYTYRLAPSTTTGLPITYTSTVTLNPDGSGTVETTSNQPLYTTDSASAFDSGGAPVIDLVFSPAIMTYLSFISYFDPASGIAWVTSQLPGAYFVTDESETASNELDFRMLVSTRVNPSPARFNALEPNSGTTITATIQTLPASTTSYPDGWTPAGDITATLYLATGSVSNPWNPPSSPPVVNPAHMPFSNVQTIGVTPGQTSWSYSFFWNALDPATGKPILGQFVPSLYVSAAATGGGVTANITMDLGSGVTTVFLWPGAYPLVCTKCSPLDGSLLNGMSFALTNGQTGPPMTIDLSYNNINSTSEPSAGRRWASPKAQSPH